MENTTIETAIGREFSKKVIPIIDNAKKSVFIMVYEWLWYPDQISSTIQLFNNSIMRAKQRGLNVKAVVWDKRTANFLTQIGLNVKWIGQSKLLHVKLMIIDEEIVIIGSHNYTKNAFDLNFEASVILNDQKTAGTLKQFFDGFFY
jgi:phosphatidylserine/phosphatidylglycerophosphate/cardiolipin synthase-like enzyme